MLHVDEVNMTVLVGTYFQMYVCHHKLSVSTGFNLNVEICEHNDQREVSVGQSDWIAMNSVQTITSLMMPDFSLEPPAG